MYVIDSAKDDGQDAYVEVFCRVPYTVEKTSTYGWHHDFIVLGEPEFERAVAWIDGMAGDVELPEDESSRIVFVNNAIRHFKAGVDWETVQQMCLEDWEREQEAAREDVAEMRADARARR